MAKYEGYIQRQQQMVEKFRHLEACAIPPDMCYDGIAGLSAEVRHKLNQVRPVSLGQASRIAGITPAAISILMVFLKKRSGSPKPLRAVEKCPSSIAGLLRSTVHPLHCPVAEGSLRRFGRGKRLFLLFSFVNGGVF